MDDPHAVPDGQSDAVVPSLAQAVSFADVQAASERLRGIALRTPVLTSAVLDARAGMRVTLKCENLQRAGAFKIRGAYNRLSQLSDKEKRGGVVAFSSGNHGAAVALAAQMLGISATIVMPADAPANKVDRTRRYGAEMIFYDRSTGDREAIAQELAHKRGATVVPPFDDARIVAGQGTAALELLAQTAEVDAIVAPTGGGGLLSGTAIAAHGISDSIQTYGVEPENGDDFRRSLESGTRITIPVPQTIADGMQTVSPGELTFQLARQHNCRILTVNDEELQAAMRFAFDEIKMVVEPSGAAALAAVLAHKIPAHHKRVGVIISGGNVDIARFTSLLST